VPTSLENAIGKITESSGKTGGARRSSRYFKEPPLATASMRSKFATGDGKGRTELMKTLTVVAVLLAMAMLPAQAQMGGMGKRGGDDRPKTEDKTPKVDEKAYKDALKRIPEPKEKYDPWGGARPATTDQKTK
jgi:hypothetical protein